MRFPILCRGSVTLNSFQFYASIIQLAECCLAKANVVSLSLIRCSNFNVGVPKPDKGAVCKTSLCGFKPHPLLHFLFNDIIDNI